MAIGALALASQAGVWTISARVEPDGASPDGTSQIAGSGFADKSKSVSAGYIGGYPTGSVPGNWPPTGSEAMGNASVGLASGSLHGWAHAAAGGLNSHHTMAFYAKLSETITQDIQPGTQAYVQWLAGDLFVSVHG